MIAAGTSVVFRKEVVDNLRDRRTLAAALFYPFLGPAMILLVVVAVGRLSRASEAPLDLPIVGIENAPNLVAFLEQNDVRVRPPPDDPEEEVRSGESDVVLVIPETYEEDFTEGRPATVRLVVDVSRNEALASIQRAELLLSAYGQQIGRLRLQARGVDPRLVDAVAIETLDLSTPQSQGARILSMAPYLILISIFVGGMYLAIDSTAGERERGSLEPLLINPIGRGELVLGKAAAVLLFTLVALVETLLGFSIVLNLVPLERYIGVQMSMPPRALFEILVVNVPLMIFVVALQMTIASYTRSFKEAQNYISFLLLVPAVPALVLSVLPFEDSLLLAALPTVGQQVFINRILRAQPLDPLHVTVSSLVTLTASLLFFALVARRYSRGILFR